MPITLDELSAHLDALDIKSARPADREHTIITGFATETYRDPEGHAGVRIVIQVEQEGRFLKVFTPMAYKVPAGPHREAVFLTLMHMSWRTKMVQFEYDTSDGEVRAMIEFPIEDGTVTQQQLQRVIVGLVKLLDDYHPTIQGAIESGKVEFPERPSTARMQAMLELLRIAAEGDPESALHALRAAGLQLPAGDGGPTEL